MTTIDKLKKLAKNVTLLYVEDDDDSRLRTAKLLGRIFPTMDVANSGESGLSLYQEKKQDLIISDIIMNNMNGLEMISLIKEIKSSQRVIFLSAYTEQKFLSQAIELGVDKFVFKPIDLEKLYLVLEKVLNQIKLTKDNQLYKNNLEKLVEERTSDLLIKNKELKEMIEEVRKGDRLKSEMLIAQKVQENFLPKEIPMSKNIKIASCFYPAEYVGGDYYDIFYSNNGVINIIMADVSGHGIVPAINMSTFRGICRSLLTLDMCFKEQISSINNLMCEDSKQSNFFITAFFIKYYENEKRFEYISAGHNEMLLYNCALSKIEKLESTAIPLGIFSNIEYIITEKTITKGDSLLLYTDGLVESVNDKEEMFGLDNLIDIFYKSKDLSEDLILRNIEESLLEFTKDETRNDDTTVLVSKFI